jgi:2-polyprenyl-3-methyl-5-hydroxy-6-metoxy-1,4-benzoquinol methylase
MLVNKNLIIEKQLGISGDYQFKALKSSNFLQANWHNNKLFVIDQILTKYHPQTILDLGTGSGNFELNFASKIKKIVGVDYHDKAIIFLKGKLKERNIENVSLINEDILNVEKIASLGKFDMIILCDVLEHLESVKAKKLIIAFHKMLNPKGIVTIITPNYSGIWPFIENLIDKFTNIPHLKNIQHITEYTPETLKNTFQKNGFKEIYSRTFNFISFIFPTKKLASFMCELELRKLNRYGNLILAVFGVS